jgi:hypothetical protein
MAGYSGLYVVGGEGGFMGADGVNPIGFQILIGESDRQWLEVHYFDTNIKPIGKLRTIIPEDPAHPNGLLDACIAFFPEHFSACRSLATLQQQLKNTDTLDLHMGTKRITTAWAKLREEARPLLNELNIWRANFERVKVQE